MAFAHGKGAAFQLDDSSGSLVDLSSYLDEVSFPRSIETGETTTFQDTSKTYVVGLRDSTLSLSGKYDPTADAHFSAVDANLAAGSISSVSFEYGPAGSASGAIKYSGEALLTSYEVSSPVADVITFSAELQVTGDVTRGTY